MERSDADLAAGRIVPASVIHADLDATIAELEADGPLAKGGPARPNLAPVARTPI